MKTLIKFIAALSLLAGIAFAQEKQQFAFAAAKQSFEKEGKIEAVESDAATAASIAQGKKESEVGQSRSTGCSVGCTVGCSVGCTVGCSVGCTVSCSIGCR